MVSKSWTYLRSVYNNSLVTLEPGYLSLGPSEISVGKESLESLAENSVGGDEGGTSTKNSSGMLSTTMETTLTTLKRGQASDTLGVKLVYEVTHLYETISGATIPKISYGEGRATFDLTNTHCELGDSALSDFVVCRIEIGCVDVDILDRRRQEVKEEAEGDAEGKAVPELSDWICRTTRRGCIGGCRKSEIGWKLLDPHQASTEGRALLVEGR